MEKVLFNKRCPHCFNNEVEAVEGYTDLYICNECGAELTGVMQYDGSMRFKNYCVDTELDDCDTYNEDTVAAVTRNYDPEKQTDWALFVYNDNDQVVNMSGFDHFITALEFAEKNNYPVIKVHNYYIQNDKHYPDGDPVVIWKDGKAYNSFIEDENGPVPDGEEVHLNESLDYSTYGNYQVELHAMYGDGKELERLVYDAFDTTHVIARITDGITISNHEDEYDVIFSLEVLDQYVNVDEIRKAVIDHLEDNDVSVTYWNINEIPLEKD